MTKGWLNSLKEKSSVVSEHFVQVRVSPVSLVLICFCFWLQALINILKQKEADGDPESVIRYLKPFRIIISLLDKPEIGRNLWSVLQRRVKKTGFPNRFPWWDCFCSGPPVLSCVLLEVVRAFHRYCLEMLKEENPPSSRLSGNQLSRWEQLMVS